jgi:hypothetical protein
MTTTDLDTSTVRDWLRNRHVHVDPFAWTGKASAFASYVAMCEHFDEPPLPEATFWPAVTAMLADDPWSAVLLVPHRDVTHLAVDDVMPLRELDGFSDPFAPPTFAVIPSRKRPRECSLTDLTRDRVDPPAWHAMP